MQRFFIEDAKVGIEYMGFAGAAICTAVKFYDGKGSMWLSVCEFEGIPTFFLSKKDIFDVIMNTETYLDAEEDEVAELYGIDLHGEYRDIFESIYKNPGNPFVSLLQYAILLTSCSQEETEPYLAMGKGKYADELELPMSEAEKDALSQKKLWEEYNQKKKNDPCQEQ